MVPNRQKLPKSLFQKPAIEVAKKLLGAKLVTNTSGVRTSGMIVEVEAYHGPHDQASHAYGGPTKRNEVMFWDGGFCYVYLIYGMHYCVNVVTGRAGEGSAVLIRALEPLEGISAMKRRRGVSSERLLTNGPGKLCQALGIDLKMLGENLLTSDTIRIEALCKVPPRFRAASQRIGISRSKELLWRLFIRDNPWVSA